MRIADIIDFDMKRAPSALLDAIGLDHPVSISEWNKHRSVEAWTVTPRRLGFVAQCSHPLIQDSILSFCDQIDAELTKCNAVFSSLSSEVNRLYRPTLPTNVDRSHIRPMMSGSGDPLYSFTKTRFTLDQDKVVDLLMGTKLYGDPSVALRELLQNSIDACQVRAAFEMAWGRGGSYKPHLSVLFDRTTPQHKLVVSDNGIGMDVGIIDNFYAKVGSCFYKSPEFYKMLAENRVKYTSISRFGIGVLSYFLVANQVIVSSRRLKGKADLGRPVLARVDGVSGLFWIEDGQAEETGTETTLMLLHAHPWRDRSSDEIRSSIAKLLPAPPFEINIDIDGNVQKHGSLSTTLSRSEKAAASGKLIYPKVNAQVRSEHIVCIDKIEGYLLECDVSWLQQSGLPLSKFEYVQTSVRVDKSGEVVPITNSIESRDSKITDWTTSITYRGERLEQSNAYHDFMESEIFLTLHGFHVPFQPFLTDDETETRQMCILDIPFHIVGRIDVSAPGDLTLNAARDNVIPDDRWFDLRNWLIRTILRTLRSSLDGPYYDQLLKLWDRKARDEWVKLAIKAFIKN